MVSKLSMIMLEAVIVSDASAVSVTAIILSKMPSAAAPPPTEALGDRSLSADWSMIDKTLQLRLVRQLVAFY